MASPIITAFQKWVELHPSKKAFQFHNVSYTYGQLSSKAAILAGALRVAGMRSGDHVGVILPNCAEFVFVLLAAAELGLVVVPQNLTLSSSALVNSFTASDVKHIIGWHSVAADLKSAGTGTICSPGSVWVALGGLVEGCLDLNEMLSGKELPLLQNDVSEHQPYILSLTSGSTGNPKPIILLQSTKVSRALAAQQLYGVTADDVTLAATPLYHSLAERLVLLPLITGGTSVLMSGFTARDWVAAVENAGVTFSIAVSSQLKQILQELRSSNHQIAGLRCVVSSSALLDSKLKAELLAYLSCDFHECYGTSEIAIASNLTRAAGQKKVASVGVAAPSVDIKILGDDDRPLPAGQPGEIVCRTPMRFAGYYKRPELTAAAMWGEYFRTGDIGQLDGEGFLYFLGRKKDIIITGGVNVYPQDIESVLLQHPQVCECAVIPMPDPRLGEVVCAVIVAQDKATLNIRELQRISARQLADYQQPHRYILLDELPKNRMGKVMKRELIERLAQSNYECNKQP